MRRSTLPAARIMTGGKVSNDVLLHIRRHEPPILGEYVRSSGRPPSTGVGAVVGEKIPLVSSERIMEADRLCDHICGDGDVGKCLANSLMGAHGRSDQESVRCEGQECRMGMGDFGHISEPAPDVELGRPHLIRVLEIEVIDNAQLPPRVATTS
jgi:hypothetical protein